MVGERSIGPGAVVEDGGARYRLVERVVEDGWFRAPAQIVREGREELLRNAGRGMWLAVHGDRHFLLTELHIRDCCRLVRGRFKRGDVVSFDDSGAGDLLRLLEWRSGDPRHESDGPYWICSLAGGALPFPLWESLGLARVDLLLHPRERLDPAALVVGSRFEDLGTARVFEVDGLSVGVVDYRCAETGRLYCASRAAVESWEGVRLLPPASVSVQVEQDFSGVDAAEVGRRAAEAFREVAEKFRGAAPTPEKEEEPARPEPYSSVRGLGRGEPCFWCGRRFCPEHDPTEEMTSAELNALALGRGDGR